MIDPSVSWERIYEVLERNPAILREGSLTARDGDCRCCEFCITGIGLIERALGDLAGLLRETRGELKPAGPIDELTVPGGEDF